MSSSQSLFQEVSRRNSYLPLNLREASEPGVGGTSPTRRRSPTRSAERPPFHVSLSAQSSLATTPRTSSGPPGVVRSPSHGGASAYPPSAHLLSSGSMPPSPSATSCQRTTSARGPSTTQPQHRRKLSMNSQLSMQFSDVSARLDRSYTQTDIPPEHVQQVWDAAEKLSRCASQSGYTPRSTSGSRQSLSPGRLNRPVEHTRYSPQTTLASIPSATAEYTPHRRFRRSLTPPSRGISASAHATPIKSPLSSRLRSRLTSQQLLISTPDSLQRSPSQLQRENSRRSIRQRRSSLIPPGRTPDSTPLQQRNSANLSTPSNSATRRDRSGRMMSSIISPLPDLCTQPGGTSPPPTNPQLQQLLHELNSDAVDEQPPSHSSTQAANILYSVHDDDPSYSMGESHNNQQTSPTEAEHHPHNTNSNNYPLHHTSAHDASSVDGRESGPASVGVVDGRTNELHQASAHDASSVDGRESGPVSVGVVDGRTNELHQTSTHDASSVDGRESGPSSVGVVDGRTNELHQTSAHDASSVDGRESGQASVGVVDGRTNELHQTSAHDASSVDGRESGPASVGVVDGRTNEMYQLTAEDVSRGAVSSMNTNCLDGAVVGDDVPTLMVHSAGPSFDAVGAYERYAGVDGNGAEEDVSVRVDDEGEASPRGDGDGSLFTVTGAPCSNASDGDHEKLLVGGGPLDVENGGADDAVDEEGLVPLVGRSVASQEGAAGTDMLRTALSASLRCFDEVLLWEEEEEEVEYSEGSELEYASVYIIQPVVRADYGLCARDEDVLHEPIVMEEEPMEHPPLGDQHTVVSFMTGTTTTPSVMMNVDETQVPVQEAEASSSLSD